MGHKRRTMEECRLGEKKKENDDGGQVGRPICCLQVMMWRIKVWVTRKGILISVWWQWRDTSLFGPSVIYEGDGCTGESMKHQTDSRLKKQYP